MPALATVLVNDTVLPELPFATESLLMLNFTTCVTVKGTAFDELVAVVPEPSL